MRTSLPLRGEGLRTCQRILAVAIRPGGAAQAAKPTSDQIETRKLASANSAPIPLRDRTAEI